MRQAKGASERRRLFVCGNANLPRRDPHPIRPDRAERAGYDLRRRLHAAERPMRGLLLLDPDPDVAAEFRVALPFDLDQEVGDALEQCFFLRDIGCRERWKW